jgi:hypothetical protein
MSVAYAATLVAIVANAVSGVAALLYLVSIIPTMGQAGVLESWLSFPIDTLTAAVPAGLFVGLLGVPLFGIVAAVVLIMVFASAISTRTRARGSSPRLGLVLGLLVLAIVTLVINVAVR